MCVCVNIYVCIDWDSYSKFTEDFALAKVAVLVHLTFLFAYMHVSLCDLRIILLENQKHSAVFTAANKVESVFTAWFQNILQSILKCLYKCVRKGYGMFN